jgi:phage gpG-like protein
VSIKVTGDFGKLSDWRKRFSASAVEKVKRAVLANIAEEALELVKEGFERESEPSGRRWAPLKHRRGRILQDTGRLRTGFHRKHVSSVSVTIGPTVKYAQFHQSGTRHMPARKMVPDGDLPNRWRVRIERAARDVMREAFGG